MVVRGQVLGAEVDDDLVPEAARFPGCAADSLLEGSMSSWGAPPDTRGKAIQDDPAELPVAVIESLPAERSTNRP